MGHISTSAVVSQASEAIFDSPLVTNIFRGHLVEAIISLYLVDAWTWCSGDYAAWDFEHSKSKLRLEVKQSAVRQTWAAPAHVKNVSTFDIRERQGRYDGALWMAEPGRFADIYVFAYHCVDDDSADHRDPQQWEFYIVPTSSLPNQKSISITRIRRISQMVKIGELKTSLAKAASSIREPSA